MRVSSSILETEHVDQEECFRDRGVTKRGGVKPGLLRRLFVWKVCEKLSDKME